MEWSRAWGLVAAATALACVAPTAHAGGAVFGAEGAPEPVLEGHRILTVWGPQRVRIHAQPIVRDAEAGFAWLLPVVSRPDVEVGDAEVLDALEPWSRPAVRELEERSPGCEDTERLPGEVVAEPSTADLTGAAVGGWEIDTYSGGSASTLLTWLDEGGWSYGEDLEAALQAQLDAGRSFVRASLVPDAGSDGVLAPEPLVLDVLRPATGRLPLGLGLSHLSAPEITPIVAYALSDKRYRVENFGALEVGHVADEIAAQMDRGEAPDYDAAVDAITASAGGRVFVTEYARDLTGADPPSSLADVQTEDAFFLTRVHARIPREALAVADPHLAFSKDGPSVDPEVVVDPGLGVVDLAAVFVLLLGLGVRRARSAAPGQVE